MRQMQYKINRRPRKRLVFFPPSLKPKSVIRHAESVSDWENEAFGHLARLDVARYAFG